MLHGLDTGSQVSRSRLSRCCVLMRHAGLQLDLVEDLARVGIHAWIFVNNGPEPNMYLEVPITGHGRIIVRPHSPSAVPGHEPRGRNHRYRCRRRDSSFLERLPEAGQARKKGEPTRLWSPHPIELIYVLCRPFIIERRSTTLVVSQPWPLPLTPHLRVHPSLPSTVISAPLIFAIHARIATSTFPSSATFGPTGLQAPGRTDRSAQTLLSAAHRLPYWSRCASIWIVRSYQPRGDVFSQFTEFIPNHTAYARCSPTSIRLALPGSFSSVCSAA